MRLGPLLPFRELLEPLFGKSPSQSAQRHTATETRQWRMPRSPVPDPHRQRGRVGMEHVSGVAERHQPTWTEQP